MVPVIVTDVPAPETGYVGVLRVTIAPEISKLPEPPENPPVVAFELSLILKLYVPGVRLFKVMLKPSVPGALTA